MELRQLLVDAHPDDHEARTDLASAYYANGISFAREDATDKARDAYEKAIVLLGDLTSAAPDDQELQRLLRRAERDLGRLEPAPSE